MRSLSAVFLIVPFALALDACSDSSLRGTDPTPSGSDASTSTSDSSTTSAPKPVVELSGDVTTSKTLSASNDYLMKGIVFVKAGATLTIEKGTIIMGETSTKATLVVQPGGRIIAEGTEDEPIVFTSRASAEARRAGDWGGLIILGNAPVNIRDANGNATTGSVEGISTGGTYGGSSADDNSGTLKYVRIEYAGVQLSPDNEVNGLTLAGVGRGTSISYVQVRHTLDDCFEFFGGTVNAHHLACQYNQDDAFDWDNGYSGKLQFLVLQQDPTFADDTNGFEGDNDAKGSANEPFSSPTAYNVTLCGKNADVAKQQYGFLLRRGTKAAIANAVVMGFEAGLDIRDNLTRDNAKSGGLSITHSIIWGSVGQKDKLIDGIAYIESQTTDKAGLDYDDDGAFDEAAWWKASGNRTVDPQISGCFDGDAPVFGPKVSLTDGAATPPNDGFFDSSAAYVGAFRDATDNWATRGKWASWARK
jgi:hypothetical protein